MTKQEAWILYEKETKESGFDPLIEEDAWQKYIASTEQEEVWLAYLEEMRLR